MSSINFPVWPGEFGWEIMTWAPYCRKMARGYDEVIVTSFAGMEPLYADFATKFIPNGLEGRSLTYPKRYRVEGEYFRYGNRIPNTGVSSQNYDVLIHARGISRKASINYKSWPELLPMIEGLKIAFIGSKGDCHIDGFDDLRGIDLQMLMDYIADSKAVIGVSAGTMHLASACGTPQVVWGDRRTYFGETLEKRYKETWNPFKTRVEYIYAEDWQPKPEEIIKRIEILMNKGEWNDCRYKL